MTLQRRCVVAGTVAGIAGLAWILHSHTWPERAWHYHVPLAFLYGTYGAWLALSVRGAPLAAHGLANVLAFLLVVVRIQGRSFLSGHGILGALLAVLAPWPWLRWSGGLVLVQAVVTKALRPEEEPWTVAAGAAAGFALGFAARRLAARRSARPEGRLGSADDHGPPS